MHGLHHVAQKLMIKGLPGFSKSAASIIWPCRLTNSALGKFWENEQFHIRMEKNRIKYFI